MALLWSVASTSAVVGGWSLDQSINDVAVERPKLTAAEHRRNAVHTDTTATSSHEPVTAGN